MGQGGNLLVRLDSVDVPLLPSEPEEHTNVKINMDNLCFHINLYL